MVTGTPPCSSCCGREEAPVCRSARNEGARICEQMYYVICVFSVWKSHCEDKYIFRHVSQALQEVWRGCRNADQRKERYHCVCVSAFMNLLLSPGERSDPEMHKQRCPLWHRRKPRSSGWERERGGKTQTNFRCRSITGWARLNLNSNLRNDNVKQALDQSLRATIWAAIPHGELFVRNRWGCVICPGTGLGSQSDRRVLSLRM